METAIERIMRTYGMLVNLTVDEERMTREKVSNHLAGFTVDEDQLAVEGLRFLRKPDRISRTRRSSIRV